MKPDIKTTFTAIDKTSKALRGYNRALDAYLNAMFDVVPYMDFVLFVATGGIRKHDQAGPWAEMLDTKNKINWI